MGRRKGKITCRKCGIVFSCLDEWEAFEDCTNANCSCPRVQEAMEIAQSAINKARQIPVKTTILKKEHEVPEKWGNTAHNKTDTMVYIEVPTIQSFKVTPLKK